MRKYLSHIEISMKNQNFYKINLFFGVFALLLSIVCLRELWQALYIKDELSLPKILSYSTLSFLLTSFIVQAFSGYVSDRVRNGDIILDLLRPWSFYLSLLSRSTGISISFFITRTIPLIIIIYVIYGFPEVVFNHIAWIIISILMAYMISFGIYYIISLMSFYFTEVWGLELIVVVLFMNVFSGAIIPLSLYPDGFRTIIYYLPFRAIYDIPLSISVGSIIGKDIIINLGIQVFWVIFLYIIGFFFLKKVEKKIIISGG